MNNVNFNYNNLSPFKWYILENFPFIEAQFDALTNWQLFCKLGKEMNKIINSVNTSGEQVEILTDAFIELQEFVNNYFENLDVQEEINNKLDELVENGTLMNIIAPYMPFITPEMYGAIGDGISDDTNAFINAINAASENKKELYLNNKIYVVKSFSINLVNDLYMSGHNTIIINENELILIGNNENKIHINDVEITNGLDLSIQQFDYVNIENVRLINQNKFGLLISNSNKVLVDKSSFYETGKNLTFSQISSIGMGLFISSVKDVLITNSYFEKNHGQGALRLLAVDNLYVNNNTFINNMFRAIELPLFNSERYNYNGKISNNYIYGCGFENINPDNDERTNGIYGNGADGFVDVIDNIIINSQENGIEGKFRHIKNNVIDGTGVGTKPTSACVGASVEFKTFENNTIRNTLSSGLSAGGDGSNRSNCCIANNMFENIGDRAGIYYGIIKGGTLIENLSIINNTCDNKPIIGWQGNISKLSVKNINLLNNKGIGLLDTSINSVLPFSEYNILDEKDLITKNNRFLNWTENKPNDFVITENATVTKEINGNDNICKIDGIAYNSYINKEFDLDKKLNETLYELIIKFKGSNIQFYLENINNDGEKNTVYTNEYISPDPNNFVEYKIVFRPYNEITTGKLNFRCRTANTLIYYKEISLSKFYQ